MLTEEQCAYSMRLASLQSGSCFRLERWKSSYLQGLPIFKASLESGIELSVCIVKFIV